VVRLRFLIVVAWVGAAVAATQLLPTLEEAQTGALGDLVPTNSEALDVELRAAELFRFPLLSRTIVVQRDPNGLSAAAQAAVVSRAVALNRNELPGLDRIAGAIAVTNALGAPPFSRERSTTALTFLYFTPDVGPRERRDLAARFAEEVVSPTAEGFVGQTGALAARAQQADIIGKRLPLVELGTVLLVLLVTGLHFRALGAPLVTLIAVGVAYLVAVRSVAGIGQALGISVPIEVEPVMVVLLFGIVTDYAIFYLSRVRQGLSDGVGREPAVRATVTELTPLIFTAGITVAGAAASLVVAELGFFQAFGPGTALAVLVGLVVALTLVPALLAIGGRWVFWPSRPGTELRADRMAAGATARASTRPVRSRAVRLASSRPLATVLGTTLVLLALATGLLRTEVGSTTIRGLPPDADARQAYAAASQGFAPGILSPTVLLLEGKGITGQRAALRELQGRLEARGGVAEVIGPADQPAERPYGAVLSQTGDAVRYLVVFDADPLGARAIASVRALRRDLPALLAASGLGGARTGLAGDTALSEETVARSGEDLARIAPTALLVVVIILAVFLRALVAPLYLVAASVLALAASLGATTYLFQDLLGYGELTYFVPFAAAVLLVALGSDYNVFLTGRIWQEARVRPLRAAVPEAAAGASRAITVAGIVLALSFAMLWLVPVRAFQELAVAMGIGLLIDAFLVRTLLVPALVMLVGPGSAWPSRFPIPEPDARAASGTRAPRRDDEVPAGALADGVARVGGLALAAAALLRLLRGR